MSLRGDAPVKHTLFSLSTPENAKHHLFQPVLPPALSSSGNVTDASLILSSLPADLGQVHGRRSLQEQELRAEGGRRPAAQGPQAPVCALRRCGGTGPGSQPEAESGDPLEGESHVTRVTLHSPGTHRVTVESQARRSRSAPTPLAPGH